MSLGKTSRGILCDERGLSLLEIIVVLIIIGLLAAFSAPTFYRGWQNLQCKRTATSLASLLRFAHHQAILTKEIQIVRIDLDGQLTKLLPANSGAVDAGEKEENEPPKVKGIAPLVFPSTVKPRLLVPEQATVIDRGQRDILFYPSGNSTGEIIELVNVLGTVYRIIVDPVTGVPVISKGTS